MIKNYSKMYKESELRDYVWKEITKYIQKEIKKDDVILDLGCGYCNFINNIIGKKKIAVDINPEFKKYANKDVEFYKLKSSSLNKINNESVDIVFTSNLLEHLTRKEIKKTILEIKRILKRKGKLIIIQPNFYYAYREYFNDFTHKTIFTHIGLCDFLEINGFKIKKVIPNFLPFSIQEKYRKITIPKICYNSFFIKLYIYSPIRPFAKQMYIVSEKL